MLSSLEQRVDNVYQFMAVSTHAVHRYRTRIQRDDRTDMSIRRKIASDVKKAMDNGRFMLERGTTLNSTTFKVNCGHYLATVVDGTIVTVYKNNLSHFKGKNGRRYR